MTDFETKLLVHMAYSEYTPNGRNPITDATTADDISGGWYWPHEIAAELGSTTTKVRRAVLTFAKSDLMRFTVCEDEDAAYHYTDAGLAAVRAALATPTPTPTPTPTDTILDLRRRAARAELCIADQLVHLRDPGQKFFGDLTARLRAVAAQAPTFDVCTFVADELENGKSAQEMHAVAMERMLRMALNATSMNDHDKSTLATWASVATKLAK